MIKHDVKCDCGRYLGTVYGTTIAEFKCGNSKCKKLKRIKVVTNDSTIDQINFKFKEEVS